MPELLCPECGKELLPLTPEGAVEHCVCSACSRKVYVREQAKLKFECEECGKEVETTVAR